MYKHFFFYQINLGDRRIGFRYVILESTSKFKGSREAAFVPWGISFREKSMAVSNNCSLDSNRGKQIKCETREDVNPRLPWLAGLNFRIYSNSSNRKFQLIKITRSKKSCFISISCLLFKKNSPSSDKYFK